MMLAPRLVPAAQSLGRRVLQASGASGDIWPETWPADAHDARPPPRPSCAVTGAKGFASVRSFGTFGQKHGQLMLMMLAPRLVPAAQSLGRRVLQASGASGDIWPETWPADAHDARPPPRPSCAVTGAKGFASVRSFGGHLARNMAS